MRLEDWIDQRHLEPSAQSGYAATFASQPYSAVVLDDFLRPEKLSALTSVFSSEGNFETRYYLWKQSANPAEKSEVEVPADTWRAAPEPMRASVENVFAGPRPEFRMGHGILCQLKFRELLESDGFMDFLQIVTAIRPATLTGFVTRIMVGGQYIQPHSDFWSTRDLCGIFYASTGWQQSFGGCFRHWLPNGDVIPVEPRANRLLLFEPRPDCKHDVKAITAEGKLWQRWAFSLWFGTLPTAG